MEFELLLKISSHYQEISTLIIIFYIESIVLSKL